MKSVQGTMVVWLQNNAGYTRWGPFDSRVDQLLDAFRPVREKERDRQGILNLYLSQKWFIIMYSNHHFIRSNDGTRIDFMPVPPGEQTKPATSTSATTTDTTTTTTTTTSTASSDSSDPSSPTDPVDPSATPGPSDPAADSSADSGSSSADAAATAATDGSDAHADAPLAPPAPTSPAGPVE